MEIIGVKEGPYLLVRNFYNEEELRLIWQELDFLTYSDKLEPPSETGQPNNDMKMNKGIFLDSLYKYRSFSNILKVNRKLWCREIVEAIVNLNKIFSDYYTHTDSDNTLVSYYEQSDYYKPHHDRTITTAISWHFREPKCFDGGQLVLPDIGHTIEVENNMLIMFPSCMLHGVIPVKMKGNYEPFSGYGRYAISNFTQFDPNKN
jgi:Rps23 Pro-64 3,4-dihydroxylase Tpa1-like proline 4-hydroxylase